MIHNYFDKKIAERYARYASKNYFVYGYHEPFLDETRELMKWFLMQVHFNYLLFSLLLFLFLFR